MKARFDAIFERMAELTQLENTTARDVAEAAELVQQAIDLLDESADNLKPEPALIARIDGETSIKFANADGLAAWLAQIGE